MQLERTVLALILAGLACQPAPPGADPLPRTLVLVIDAVPFAAVAQLQRESPERLRGYAPPRPLLSAFPSQTPTVSSGLFEPFGIERAPGYEIRYYDRAAGELRGGGLLDYHTLDYPYHRFFDWRLDSLVVKALVYARPQTAVPREVGRALAAFAASRQRLFFAHVDSTDALGHGIGPQAYPQALAETLDAIAALRRDHPTLRFATVLLSDHGMAGAWPLRNVFDSVEAGLRQAGLRPARALRDDTDAVLVPIGLVASFVVYAAAHHADRLASTLVRLPGIELCVHPDGAERWRIIALAGQAELQRRRAADRVAYRYRIVSGDPLQLQALQPGGTTDLRAHPPWLDDRVWLAATADHLYPDPLHRLVRAFELVQNPATLICSLAPGYMFGGLGAQLGAGFWYGGLRWTHGSLRRADSRGFVLTDRVEALPAGPLRFDELLWLLTPQGNRAQLARR